MKILATYKDSNTDDVSLESLKHNVDIIKQMYVPDGMEIDAIDFDKYINRKSNNEVSCNLVISKLKVDFTIDEQEYHGVLLAKDGYFEVFHDLSARAYMDAVLTPYLRNENFSIYISMSETLLSDGTTGIQYTAIPNSVGSDKFVQPKSKWFSIIRKALIEMYNSILDSLNTDDDEYY